MSATSSATPKEGRSRSGIWNGAHSSAMSLKCERIAVGEEEVRLCCAGKNEGRMGSRGGKGVLLMEIVKSLLGYLCQLSSFPGNTVWGNAKGKSKWKGIGPTKTPNSQSWD